MTQKSTKSKNRASRTTKKNALARRRVPEGPDAHEANVNQMAANETAAAVKQLNQLAARMQEIGRNIEKEGIEVANIAIQMGFLFQTATGREQMEFYLFEKLPGLSKDINFDLAQRTVSMVNRLGPKFKFTTFAQAQPELKFLFSALGITAPPHRESLGQPVASNWGTWIATKFIPINKDLQELFKTEPINEWDPERCETFLAQTEFIEQKRVEVKEKLKEK